MTAAVVSILSCATFLISLQYSNSCKSILIKDNIEAITGDDDDPGKKLRVTYCALKTHRQPDEDVIVCQEKDDPLSTGILPCVVEHDRTAEPFWPTGRCYQIPVD